MGAAVVAGLFFALLTLFSWPAVGGKMLVGARRVGSAGGGFRLGGNRIRPPALDAVLNNSSGDIRRIAEVMVSTAQDSMHQWLNITLIVGGGGLVIIGGVIVSLLVSLARTN